MPVRQRGKNTLTLRIGAGAFDGPFTAMKIRSTALRAMSSIRLESVHTWANVFPSMADTVGSLESVEM